MTGMLVCVGMLHGLLGIPEPRHARWYAGAWICLAVSAGILQKAAVWVQDPAAEEGC